MKSNSSSYGILFLATLPLLDMLWDFRWAVILGAFVCVMWWWTTLFFRVTQPLFPKKLFRIALILWIATIAQMMWYSAGINPLWGISLFILTLGKIGKEDSFTESWKEVFKKGIGFWSLVVILAGVHEMLGRQFVLATFQLPAGSFLILALVALLWQGFRKESLS